jgi:adenosylcobinamide-phosphate synthase
MAGEVALGLTPALAPDPWLLGMAVALDLALGDPSYPAHPIRLMGASLSWIERILRRAGADGYGGGIALFAVLASLWLGLTSLLVVGAGLWSAAAAKAVHLFLLYSLLALGSLLRHGWAVEAPLRREDLAAARQAVAQLVGRDTDRMDAGACRRAVIESLSENLTDGFVSPIFWYVLAGLPGIVLFKIVSTMDSMVGYKTPRYLRFGWCGARLDDVMNWLPARATWLLLALTALVVPGCSAPAAVRIGWQQHGTLPSPNSGWPETATAGAIQRRLAGPIWLAGALVTDIWLGDPSCPPVETAGDYQRAQALIVACGIATAALAVGVLAWIRLGCPFGA